MIALYHFKDGASDKIWGWAKTDDGALSFWGRTKGSLSFKQYSSVWDAEDQAHKKQRKGYAVVSKNTQELGPASLDLLPDDFKGQLMLAKLGMTKF
jgi:hypothetical protein